MVVTVLLAMTAGTAMAAQRGPVLRLAPVRMMPAHPTPIRAPAASMSLALPSCSAAAVLTTAARAGAVGLVAQLGLFALFQRSSDPILSRAPGYSAHSAVALMLMIFCAGFGLVGWLHPPAAAATAAGRLLAESNSARWLGATLLGMLLVWDIPTCLLIGRLRKPDMLGHHAAMAATAFVGATALPTHYGLYYMGVVELSSIPLTAYDQLELSAEIGSSLDELDETRKQRLRSLRDLFRTVAALTFIPVRAVDFTRVTLASFVPDALSTLSSPATAARFVLPLRFMLVSSVCFVALQLYWFSLFVRISLAQRAREKRRKGRQQRRQIEEGDAAAP